MKRANCDEKRRQWKRKNEERDERNKGRRKKERKKERKEEKRSGTKPREAEDDQSTAHADSIEPETRVV